MKVIWIFLIATAFIGCKNEGCTNFAAENYDPDATSNDGSCILTRDKFLGEFNVNSDCFANDYPRNISTTQNEYVVVISNLADTLGDVQASVFGENITIELQTISNLITVEGAGVYVTENQTISMTYRIRDNRNGMEVIHDCFETCSKL